MGALKNLPQYHWLYTEVSTVIIRVLWHEGERDPEARWILQRRTSRKTRRRWGP